MRQAIMENIRVEFAQPRLPTTSFYGYPPMPNPYSYGPMNFRPPGSRPPPPMMPMSPGGKPGSRGRGLLGKAEAFIL